MRKLRNAIAGGLGALSLVGAVNAVDSPTNMNIRLVPIDAGLNPISRVFVDTTSTNNYMDVGVFVRGNSSISPTEVVNTFNFKYRDPDGFATNLNYNIVQATSYAFTSNGPFNGFDVGLFNDTAPTNAYASQFQTDIANNGTSYGPNPMSMTSETLLVDFRIALDWTKLTAGFTTNAGSFTIGSAKWGNNSIPAKVRTMIQDATPNYQIVFVPEPGTNALMAAGGLVGLAALRRRARRKTTGNKSIDDTVDKVMEGK